MFITRRSPKQNQGTEGLDPVIEKPSDDPTTTHKGFQQHTIEFVQSLVVFLAIGSIIYLFAVQPHKVSGCSMCPNFHTGDLILTDKITYRFQSPQHGDVIVFKYPRDTTIDFIKRVIAIPGDRVEVKDGHVYVNDQIVMEPYIDSSVKTDPGAFLREGQPFTVEPNHLIAMGDNRPGSSDSREWGEVPYNDIIGKAFIRYWPLDKLGTVQSSGAPELK